MEYDSEFTQEEKDSHGLEGFMPDWDPEAETRDEYEERKQKEQDSILPFI